MTDATEQQLETALAPLRERLMTHPLYAHLRDEETLRIFMAAHVFAVWDFQCLLKALQRLVTCVEVPWLPTADPEARRLLNEIVLDEESDQAPGGGYLSHFELYRQAMQEWGLSRRLLNLAERGSSGAQHTARAAVRRIADARARGDTDMAVPLLKIDPGANAGLGLSACMAGTAMITRRALPRPRGGGRWQALRGHRGP